MNKVLYSGTKNASSWAFRAWLALKETDIEFEERVIDIRRPQRYGNLNRISDFSPPGAVPVLVDNDTVIFDSLAIMEYANDLSGGILLPDDLRIRARSRSFMAWQHADLGKFCPLLSFESVFYPDKRAMTFDERNQAAHVYGSWEQQLSSSGGPYLFGSLSLADLALVPSVMRLTAHSEDLANWPTVQTWSNELLSRPTVREWVEQAESLPPVWYCNYLP